MYVCMYVVCIDGATAKTEKNSSVIAKFTCYVIDEMLCFFQIYVQILNKSYICQYKYLLISYHHII